jgi:hypothetical protein
LRLPEWHFVTQHVTNGKKGAPDGSMSDGVACRELVESAEPRRLPAARRSQEIPAGFIDPAAQTRDKADQKFAVTSA